MSNYDRFFAELREKGTSKLTVSGNSMMPKIKSKSTLTYKVSDTYEVGDVVFCRVKGNFIPAHLIISKDGARYLIANNSGRENGWTRQIFAKVTEVEPP